MKTTRNYNKFSFFKQNRELSNAQIGKLAQSITNIDMTRHFPILVDEDLRIIDGQHRFKACQRLKMPIHYTIVKLNGGVDTAMKNINSNQKSWTLPHWINHYANLDYKDYITLQNAQKTYKLHSSIAIALVSNIGGTNPRAIRMGLFKVGAVPIDTMVSLYDDYKEIFDYANKVNFVRAFVSFVTNPKYNHSIMFPKILKNRYSMFECATTDQYKKMFADVVNKRMRNNKIEV